jgi:hypothetical protein
MLSLSSFVLPSYARPRRLADAVIVTPTGMQDLQSTETPAALSGAAFFSISAAMKVSK